jgi:hypothetical protein
LVANELVDAARLALSAPAVELLDWVEAQIDYADTGRRLACSMTRR